MAEVLSDSEIDQLLNLLDPTVRTLSKSEIEQIIRIINEGDSEPEVQDDRRKIILYDFKRQRKMLKIHLNAIKKIHDKYSSLLASSLSSKLLLPVNIEVATVDELTYDEYIRTLPTPTTLVTVGMDPLGGDAILEIDPVNTVTIINQLRMFNNPGEKTDILKIITEISTHMLEKLSEAWTSVIALRPTIIRIDTDPKLIQISQSGTFVLITLETKIGDVEGMINFCIPYSIIKPIINKINSNMVDTNVIVRR